MPKKSIFKQPGVRHFQLVHRSQRDPLIHDPEASAHVLKPIVKGKSRAELEQSLSPEELAHDLQRTNLGEASLFGIYYDDTEYDYLQHLRELGRTEDGVETILIEAPAASKGKGKEKGRNANGIDLLDLPSEALPSRSELSREQVFEAQGSVPAELEGLQPDMNPHLRQTIEALDDDAFVDDTVEDDFFEELLGDGELDGDADDLDFEFAEEGVDEGEETEKEDGLSSAATALADGHQDEGWEARFSRFKKAREAKMKEAPVESDIASDVRSERGDTIGQLPSISVIGGKKRRKGASDASGYSMSSSSMFRNEGLSVLDERFDQVEKEYESDEEEPSDDSDQAPDLITSREDFNAIMDDFLNNFEVLGGKMRPVLEGETVADKLGTIRQSLKEIGYDPRAQLSEDEDESDDAFEAMIEKKEDRWDCETIISTYSNLENHPRLIRAREATKVPKIHLDPKAGIPIVKTSEKSPRKEPETTRPARKPITRKKDESKEEKRLRKQAIREGRQARRVEKKETRAQFASEKRHQLHVLSNTNTKEGIRKL